ncbi:MAG: cation-transporting P-type ATPase [Clostridia bacterium]|nr:cation-transporting P-type ATPase [Clostridia bacterium]
MIWHSEAIETILKELDVSRSAGLANAQAEARTERYGKNLPPKQETHSFWACLQASLKAPGIAIMLIAAIGIAAFAIYRSTKGHPSDWSLTVVMAVAAIVYALVLALVRYIAEKRYASAPSYASTGAKVLRDGKWYTAAAERLVPGDIIRLTEGDLVPADCRILESYSLLCDEAVLTGDTIPAAKSAVEKLNNITPFKKRSNMLYAGCMVVLGSAEAVVVETGGQTEINRMRVLKQDDHLYLPHQQELGKIGRAITAVAVIGALLVLAAAMVSQDMFFELTWSDMFLTAAAIVVAAAALTLGVPALMAITATLKRLKRHGIGVQSPNAVETIGQANVIVLDRFSILTENAFSVKELYTGHEIFAAPNKNPEQAVISLIQLATLCTRDPEVNDPLDTAIDRYAKSIRMEHDKLHGEFPRLGEIPSAADRHCMTAIHLISGKNVAILKGDPAEVLPRCAGVNAEAVNAQSLEMENRGERVLAVAYRYVDELSANLIPEEIEKDMIFVGLIGLADPPRAKAEKALFECMDAGITTMLITGDSMAVAAAGALSIGLITDESQVLDGTLLETMSDDEIKEILPRTLVISRPSAADRVRLVQLLQKSGKVVIMTGDDARDAAAMKEADISVAIGECADVATIGADLIIPDGRFETLRYAVRAGRGMLTTMRKAVSLRLALTVALVATEMLGLLFGGCLLLSPMMLLVISLLTELLLIPAIACEKPEQREMRLAPHTAETKTFTPLWMFRGVLQGLLIAATPATVFAMVGVSTGDWNGLAVSQATIAFLLSLAAQALVFRSSLPTWLAPFNWRIVAACAAIVVLALMLPSMPPIAAVCGITGIGDSLSLALTVTVVLLVAADILKSLLSLLVGSRKNSH